MVPKIVVLLISFLLYVLPAPAKSPGELLASFDIDWVSFYTLQEGQTTVKGDSYFIDGKTYVPTPYLGQVVQVLMTQGFQIGFISGGNIERNVPLLNAYKIDGERSLADVSKILSKSDLYEVPGVSKTDYFSNQFKKDLSKYGVPESNVAHIDDMMKFAFNVNQEKSFIGLLGTFVHLENYSEYLENTRGKFEAKYVPTSRENWTIEQAKLVYALGVIMTARDSWRRDGGEFREQVSRHGRDKNGNPLSIYSNDAMMYLQRGIQEIEIHFKNSVSRSFRNLKETVRVKRARSSTKNQCSAYFVSK